MPKPLTTITITHNIGNIDATNAVAAAMYLNAWEESKSATVTILRAIDAAPISLTVTDLNPNDSSHDRQFRVEE